MKLLLLALPCLLLVPLDGTQLVFGPQECSKVSKQFDFELELSDTSLVVNGDDWGASWIPTVRLTTSVALEDKYTKTAGGRPINLSRTFGKLSGKWFYGDVPEDILGFFALSDSTVEFEWDPKHENYAKSLISGIVRGVALENLIEDADLRGLLPPQDVKLGSKWTAKGRPAMDALFGSSEMGMLGSPTGSDEALFRDILLRPFRERGEQGLEVECTHLGPSEPDSTLVTVHIAIDAQFELDITRDVNDYLMTSGYDLTTISFDLCRLKCVALGKGTLVWDVEAGHFDGFSMSSTLKLTCDMKLAQPYYYISELEVMSTGTATWNYSAKPVE